MKYKIEWEDELHDIDGIETPLEAVKSCIESISNGNALAFTVTDLETKQKYSVDLNEEKGAEVLEIGD